MPQFIVLTGTPQSTNHLYKPTGRGIYLTQEGKALKEDYAWQAKTQWKGKPLTGALEVTVNLFFADKRRRDWDNFNKIWADALTGIAYEDDSQIVAAHVFKNVGPDPKKSRIEIAIRPIA